jgi:hypothetical protein
VTYPIRTIDLPCRLLRVQGGTFRLSEEGEFSSGQWATTPRSTGPRFSRWMVDLDLVPFTKGANGDLRFEWEVFVARLGGTSRRLQDVGPAARAAARGRGWHPGIHVTQMAGAALANMSSTAPT